MHGSLAIVGCDDLLREHRQPPDRDEFKIEHCLLILHEGAVEATATALVSGVAAGDRETACQRRLVPDGLVTDRLAYGSVQATAALLQKIAVPVFRQRHRESNAVGLAVRTRALVDDAIHAA